MTVISPSTVFVVSHTFWYIVFLSLVSRNFFHFPFGFLFNLLVVQEHVV